MQKASSSLALFSGMLYDFMELSLSKTWICILLLGAVVRKLIGRELRKVWRATFRSHHREQSEK